MPTKPKPTIQSRMLELMDEAIYKGEVVNDKAWCNIIGILQNNLKGYREGARKFTVEQLIRAAKLHNTTLDYICGLTANRAKPEAVLTPVQMIEQGLQMLKSNLS